MVGQCIMAMDALSRTSRLPIRSKPMKIEFESISLNLETPFRPAYGTILVRHDVLTVNRNGWSGPCPKRTRTGCVTSASSHLSLSLLTSQCAQPGPDGTEKDA